MNLCKFASVCTSLCDSASFYMSLCESVHQFKDFVLIYIVKNPFPYNSNTILKVTDGATNMISDVNGLCGLVRRALERENIICHHCLAHRIELGKRRF